MNKLYTYRYHPYASLIIVATMALFFASSWSIADAASPTEFPTSGTILRNARARSGPGTSYNQVGSLRAGTTIQLATCNSSCDWYKLPNGQWVAGFLVQLNTQVNQQANPASPMISSRPTSIPTLYQVVTKQDANLRSGPGINNSTVGTIQGGRTVNVSGQSPDSRWLQLDNGVWIAASLVQRATGAPAMPNIPTIVNVAKPTSIAQTASAAPCACDRDRYNCGSFSTLKEAQRCANYCASQNLGDVHNMDLNQNGLVCENVWPPVQETKPQMDAPMPAPMLTVLATSTPQVPIVPTATPRPPAPPTLALPTSVPPTAMPAPIPSGQETAKSSSAPTSSQASASASILSCSCSADIYDCSDFISQSSAQSCFWYCGSLDLGDIHNLDLDDNQVVCDESNQAKSEPIFKPIKPVVMAAELPEDMGDDSQIVTATNTLKSTSSGSGPLLLPVDLDCPVVRLPIGAEGIAPPIGPAPSGFDCLPAIFGSSLPPSPQPPTGLPQP